MATLAQVNNFINTIAPIAQAQAQKHGNKIYASVCIAQACLESAYGTSTKMIKANAVFGIKVGKSAYKFGTAWKGKGYSTATQECYNGAYQSIVDMFRAYDSLSDSVEDYFDMLCTASRYKYALNQPNPFACITGIQKGPYATAPDYVTKVMSIINKYGLEKYDGKVSANVSLYGIGATYTTNTDLYVRNKADGEKLKFDALTPNAKQNAFYDEYGNAILRKGTRVTCNNVVILKNSTWIKIPSGWICAKSGSRVYINE